MKKQSAIQETEVGDLSVKTTIQGFHHKHYDTCILITNTRMIVRNELHDLKSDAIEAHARMIEEARQIQARKSTPAPS
jgi:hypothetical protein